MQLLYIFLVGKKHHSLEMVLFYKRFVPLKENCSSEENAFAAVFIIAIATAIAIATVVSFWGK